VEYAEAATVGYTEANGRLEYVAEAKGYEANGKEEANGYE